MMKRSRIGNERGVTLVELMVVVAIIAIIAAIAITLYQDVQKKARLAADQGTLAAIRSAIAIYYGKNDGFFPPVAQPQQPPYLQAAAVWQCPGNAAGVVYDPNTGLARLPVNNVSGC